MTGLFNVKILQINICINHIGCFQLTVFTQCKLNRDHALKMFESSFFPLEIQLR